MRSEPYLGCYSAMTTICTNIKESTVKFQIYLGLFSVRWHWYRNILLLIVTIYANINEAPFTFSERSGMFMSMCKSLGTSMSTLRNTSTHTCTSVTMSVGRCMSTSIFTSSSMGLWVCVTISSEFLLSILRHTLCQISRPSCVQSQLICHLKQLYLHSICASLILYLRKHTQKIITGCSGFESMTFV